MIDIAAIIDWLTTGPILVAVIISLLALPLDSFKHAKEYMSEADLQAAKKFVYGKAFQRAEAFPVLARLLAPKSKKTAAPDPDTFPLSSLVPGPKSKSGGGRKRQTRVPAAPSGPSDAREATAGGASSERARPSAANDML